MPFVRGCRRVALLVGLLVTIDARAQLPTAGGTNPLFDTAQPDSLPEDSNRKVPPRVARLVPAHFWEGRWAEDTSDVELRFTHVWDERDTLRGWRQTLGQVGKPYQTLYGGLPGYYTENQVYRNPLTGQPEVYILEPERQIPHYDTRTPYVVGHFHQAATRSQFLNTQFSQNITPFWNATVYYNRRASQGPYPRQQVDHITLAASLTYRPFGGRWVFLINSAFNQLGDEMNGGADLQTNFATADIYSELLTPTLLDLARLRRRQRSLNGWLRYRIVGDSLRNASILFQAGYQDYQQRYSDTQTGTIPTYTYNRGYGRLPVLSKALDEVYTVRQLYGRAGLQGAVRLGGFQGLAIGQAGWERSRYHQTDSLVQIVDQTRSHLEGFLALRDTQQTGLQLEARGRYTLSNRFSPEQRLDLLVRYSPRIRTYSLPDSFEVQGIVNWRWRDTTLQGSYAPWEIRLEGFFHNRNPSVYQAFWRTQLFVPENGLQNEQVGQLWLGLTFTGPPRTRNGFLYQPNQYRLRGVVSYLRNPIYPNALGQSEQWEDGIPVQWYGAEAFVRQRIVDRIYLEGTATYLYSPRQRDEPIRRLQLSQPDVYGEAGLYYAGKLFRGAYARFRMGLFALFFTDFFPLSFDSGTQLFYPNNNFVYRQPGFMRVDFRVSAQLSPAAQMFLSWQFLNNLFAAEAFPGYLTTSLYPEWPAALTWGVRYRFFD